MPQSLTCFHCALPPPFPCPRPPFHLPSGTLSSPHSALLLPTGLSLAGCGDAIGHICFQPLLAIESTGSLSVFAPYLIRLSPITYPEESDFGATELSVEGGEIVRHHLKGPVPSLDAWELPREINLPAI